MVYLLFFRKHEIPEKYNKAIWFILFSIPFTYSIKIADYFDALLWYLTKKVTHILPTGDFPSIYDCSSYLGIKSTYIIEFPDHLLDACFFFLPSNENEVLFMMSRFMSSAAFLLFLYFFKYKKNKK